jgi:hypothetical protein
MEYYAGEKLFFESNTIKLYYNSGFQPWSCYLNLILTDNIHYLFKLTIGERY